MTDRAGVLAPTDNEPNTTAGNSQLTENNRCLDRPGSAGMQVDRCHVRVSWNDDLAVLDTATRARLADFDSVLASGSLNSEPLDRHARCTFDGQYRSLVGSAEDCTVGRFEAQV